MLCHYLLKEDQHIMLTYSAEIDKSFYERKRLKFLRKKQMKLHEQMSDGIITDVKKIIVILV